MNFAALLQLFHSISLNATECFGQTNALKHGESYDKEYKLFDTRATYDEAMGNCQAWGRTWKSVGRLATIPDESVQRCVTNMIKKEENYLPKEWESTGHYFIGGSAHYTGWSWANGKPIHLPGQSKNFQRWSKNEPQQNDPGKKCMAMIMHGRKVGAWVQESCQEKLFYVCERDVSKHRVWGFKNDSHAIPPQKWSSKEDFASCNGSRQSPVDVRADKLVPQCPGQDGNLVGWENSTNVRWRIENTGRMIKITTEHDRSVYAVFRGSDRRHYVDYMLLKWGATRKTGSEHTVQGLRHAGELQIFHHPPNGGGDRYAVAFMIKERSFQSNDNWSDLLSHISLIQEPDTSTTMEAPLENIMTLLTDSVPTARFATATSILAKGVRYRGSLPHPPCTEDVTWTIYTRPINLSFGQFLGLRHTHIEGRQGNNRPRLMNGNHRPIQTQSPQFTQSNRHCLVEM